jgi:oligosaccharyltransferase complex subunit alpha (ribophorin I)
MIQVQATVQKIQGIFERYLAVHDKLEASLRDLSRTGDTQTCKAARKAADAQFKELSKDLKLLLTSLQSSPQSYQIWPKVCYLLIPRNNILILLYLATSHVIGT